MRRSLKQAGVYIQAVSYLGQNRLEKQIEEQRFNKVGIGRKDQIKHYVYKANRQGIKI
jgi:hypothetical protein